MRPNPSKAVTGMIAIAAVAWAYVASAREYPIGKPTIAHGMEVAAVFLQPVTMEPAGMMRPAASSDIHLEADIHATKDDTNGFADGVWIPYLLVRYTLTKSGTGQSISGKLMPMVAKDGPHYGDNIKLMGPGKYDLTLTVQPPTANPQVQFGRHVDRETGVGPWFKPFTVKFAFVFAGAGKKGAY